MGMHQIVTFEMTYVDGRTDGSKTSLLRVLRFMLMNTESLVLY